MLALHSKTAAEYSPVWASLKSDTHFYSSDTCVGAVILGVEYGPSRTQRSLKGTDLAFCFQVSYNMQYFVFYFIWDKNIPLITGSLNILLMQQTAESLPSEHTAPTQASKLPTTSCFSVLISMMSSNLWINAILLRISGVCVYLGYIMTKGRRTDLALQQNCKCIQQFIPHKCEVYNPFQILKYTFFKPMEAFHV